ncbi:glycosyltransferase [Abyssicoccus albus]|uniref:glycosyltransferase n=1 Tax=Abyssicoccus albus TaxID=1817405 RepID=UPI00097E3214|nr:glycosyltransferase [Abyssicoccus albus]AQL55898.1 hypothetical protein BVH56_02675 [Abyssicoccus albus]
MKILHINLNYKVSGIYKELNKVQLKDSDLDPTIWYPVNKSDEIKGEANNIFISKSLTKSDKFLFNTRKKKLINVYNNKMNDNYDLIHCHSLFSNGILGYEIAKQNEIPLIIAVRNTDINIFFKYFKHLKYQAIKALLYAKKIVLISHSYKEKFLSYIPIKYKKSISDKIIIIPNGISDFWIENINDSETNKSKTFKLLTVGHIVKNKNQLNVAKAVKNINDITGKVKIDYTIIGKVKDNSYFKKINNVLPDIKHLDQMPKEELIKHFRNSDLMILPSFKETFGLAYIESISQNIPVVTSKNQGIDKMFNSKFVRSVNPNSVDEIQNILMYFIDMKPYDLDGYKNLANNFSWANVNDQYKKIYTEVISNG